MTEVHYLCHTSSLVCLLSFAMLPFVFCIIIVFFLTLYLFIGQLFSLFPYLVFFFFFVVFSSLIFFFFFFLMIRRPPRSTLFPSRRSSDLESCSRRNRCEALASRDRQGAVL